MYFSWNLDYELINPLWNRVPGLLSDGAELYIEMGHIIIMITMFNP